MTQSRLWGSASCLLGLRWIWKAHITISTRVKGSWQSWSSGDVFFFFFLGTGANSQWNHGGMTLLSKQHMQISENWTLGLRHRGESSPWRVVAGPVWWSEGRSDPAPRCRWTATAGSSWSSTGRRCLRQTAEAGSWDTEDTRTQKREEIFKNKFLWLYYFGLCNFLPTLPQVQMGGAPSGICCSSFLMLDQQALLPDDSKLVTHFVFP